MTAESPTPQSPAPAPAPEVQITSNSRPLLLRYWVTASILLSTIYFAWRGQLSPGYENLEAFTLSMAELEAGELWRLVTSHLLEPSALSLAIGLFVNFSLFSSLEGTLGSKACLFFFLFVAICSSTTEIYVTEGFPRAGMNGIFLGTIAALAAVQFARSPSASAFFFSGQFFNLAFILALIAALEIHLSGRLVPAGWVPFIPAALLGWSWAQLSYKNWRSKLGLTILILASIVTLATPIWLINPGLPTINISAMFRGDAVTTALTQRKFTSDQRQSFTSYAKELEAGEKYRVGAAAWLIAGDFPRAAEFADNALYDNENDLQMICIKAIASYKRGNKSYARQLLNRVLSEEDTYANGIARFWLADMATGAERQHHIEELKKLATKDSSLSDLITELDR